MPQRSDCCGEYCCKKGSLECAHHSKEGCQLPKEVAASVVLIRTISLVTDWNPTLCRIILDLISKGHPNHDVTDPLDMNSTATISSKMSRCLLVF
jgi:hypothetical protein